MQGRDRAPVLVPGQPISGAFSSSSPASNVLPVCKKKPLGCPVSAKDCSIGDAADMLERGPKRIYQATRMKCLGCHPAGAYKAVGNLIARKGV